MNIEMEKLKQFIIIHLSIFNKCLESNNLIKPEMKKLLLFTFLNLIITNAFSQTSDELVRQGLKKELNKNYQGAFNDFQNATIKDPTNAEAYYYEALVCEKVFSIETIKLLNLKMCSLNKAIELNPNYVEAYFYRGLEKFNLNDYWGAISDYNTAIEIDPNSYETYAYRGVAKFQLKDNSGALNDFNKAIEINPKYAFAYGSRGIFKFNLGQKIEACLDFSKSGELGNKGAYDYIKQYCN
jgi:tetratricopeptide (TPR) repeat protein